MHILKPIAPIIKKIAKVYTSREREFSYKDITVNVKPGVFHPGLFISTKILLNFVDELYLENKSFLELGAGTGIISILAANKGAEVYASDINNTAIENIKLNADRNCIDISLIESDLFKDIQKKHFDFIVINPPYYQKDPETKEEYAWFCGSNFEYFTNLFSSLPDFINKDSKVFIILSEVCDIKKIKSIGEEKGLNWKTVQRKTVWCEKNFIFSLELKD